MSVRPNTFVLTLPNGEKVTCWQRDAEAIRRDVLLTGNVILIKDPLSEVYERVAPDSVEAPKLREHGRHVK